MRGRERKGRAKPGGGDLKLRAASVFTGGCIYVLGSWTRTEKSRGHSQSWWGEGLPRAPLDCKLGGGQSRLDHEGRDPR